MQCPVRIEQYGLRDDSCGDGEYRGGCGMRRDVRILSDSASLSVLADHAVIPPFGVAGGYSGDANRFVVIRDGKTIQPSPVPGKVGDFALLKGDIVRMESSGGGGYGDPLAREPARVRRDVFLGYIDTEHARRRYGVVIDLQGEVDSIATQAERKRLQELRFTLPVQLANEDELDGSRRRIILSEGAAGRLGASAGDLIELSISSGAAALRGWVQIAATEDVLRRGPLGLAALGANPGDQIELRTLKASS